MTTDRSKTEKAIILELTSFFDMLAKFDFEDAQKHQVIVSQEVEKGFSPVSGKPLSVSCENQDS